ncbi:MAG: DUF4290 domain-containing protein [Bacteroidales bacterium]|jgi:hypothetical protein|nr:DUF4290 domain-containing protein [Bacteroidales bacterium]MBP5135025.1 DUF4290 domain-containing protein [Paludibacteraceae bacterium]MBR6310015.1 DUF4290 domain-containing protein [Paludibacteraceae bacterium]MDD6357701.1 DUF4290 domain-containing protein [Bacteroidales bacterium]
MEYTTKQKRIILPEYGRNVQQMVDYACTIEDREERMKCAKSIIATMGNLFPYLRDVNDFKHKLWDHLAIMSDFKLDIDYPYDVMSNEKLQEKPEKVPYPDAKIKYMHYGKALQEMISRIDNYEGEQREALIKLIANQMKKAYCTWNKDNVEDQKILDDLCEMTDGKVALNAENFKLQERKENFVQRNNNNNQKNNQKNKKRKQQQ